jgi:GNAT superfamily N-acetyltransferase
MTTSTPLRHDMNSVPPQPAPFTLRPATRGDVPTILSCIKALAEFERLSHECLATEALLAESLFGPSPAADVTLAFAGEAPAGFALWFRTYSTFLGRPGLYLEDLFVFQEFRGRGLGRQLLASLAQTAATSGYGRLEWAVLNWNVDAIRFYESLGAVPTNEWTKYRLADGALHALAHET